MSSELGEPVPIERESPPAPAPPGEPRVPALRLSLEPGDLPRFRRHPLLAALAEAPPTRQLLHFVYHDTPELDLAAAGWALRLRRVGRQHVQTLEVRGTPGLGPVVARELDALVPGPQPALDAIPDLELREQLRAAVGEHALAPVFEARFERSRRTLREDGSALRLDLDVGEIRSAWGTIPLCDVELIGRGSDPGHPYRLALELLDDLALRPMTRSIAERGAERVSGRGPAVHKAGEVAVSETASVEELLLAVVATCVAQVLANEPAAQEGVDPEGVHQLRVGVRRLRSALGFFDTVLPERQTAPLRESLRWLAGELGPARDQDVFLGELLDPLVETRPEDLALARLRAAADESRAEAYHRVRDALRSSRYPRLALELGAWLARRAWREQPLSEHSAQLFLPARAFVEDRLQRRQRKVRKLGRRLAELTPEERHRLRIRVKKLRYAAEFAQGLYPGRRAERYARRLSRLQDALGHLNDVAAADRLLAEALARLGPDAPPETPRAAGFVAGWVAHSAHVELGSLPRRWARFEAAGRFW